MKKKLGIFVMIMFLITALAACGDNENSRKSEHEKLVVAEAENMIKEDVIPSYKKLGIDIDDFKVTGIKAAAQIPYSGGGTFDFYEINFKLQPKDSKQLSKSYKMYGTKIGLDEDGWIIQDAATPIDSKKRVFISAYNDGGKLYEFNRYYGADLYDFMKNKKYNKKAFANKVKYLYEDIKPVEVEKEYTLKIGNKNLSIGENFKGRLPFEDVEVTKEASGDLMGVMTRHKEIWKTEGFYGETYCYFEKHYEPLLRMATTNPEAETARGVKVGATEQELFEAYGVENLVFAGSAFDGGNFNGFSISRGLLGESKNWTCFGFTGKDKTNNYIAFYMISGKVAIIEMGIGFDYKPFQKVEGKYLFEAEELINEHIDEANVMKYDIRIPKIKDSVNSNESINSKIQNDFEQIIGYSQNRAYEPIDTGFIYPWVKIDYGVSNLGEVAVLNIFTTYSSALGAGENRYVKSYYYDTTCGARMSEEAALYKLGYTRSIIEEYFKYLNPTVADDLGVEATLFENIIFYFEATGEMKFLINGYS